MTVIMMVEGGKDDYVVLNCSQNLRHETPDDRIMHKSAKNGCGDIF